MVNSDKTSITLNDEYFDDGSRQLVPIKHPDLSTQPSILPYKFMGRYVYEQLIPVRSRVGEYGMDEPIFDLAQLETSNPIFLDACAISKGRFAAVHIYVRQEYFHVRISVNSEDYNDYEYIRVVYTSTSEEEGDYYGYNSY